MMPGLALLEVIARIVVLAMEGQTPEQRVKMWDWYITDTERMRKFFKMDA